MNFFYLALAGVCGGVLGGMGMGGGTLLIPILTLLLDIPQNAAQWLNLLSFIPMSIVAVSIHAKNKLIVKKALPLTIIPAALAAIFAAWLASKTEVGVLRSVYGIFLIVSGGILLISKIISIGKKAKNAKSKEEIAAVQNIDKNEKNKN